MEIEIAQEGRPGRELPSARDRFNLSTDSVDLGDRGLNGVERRIVREEEPIPVVGTDLCPINPFLLDPDQGLDAY